MPTNVPNIIFNPMTGMYEAVPVSRMQPQNIQPQNMNGQKLELSKVNGLQGVKSFQMPAESTVPLFDVNEDIVYIKTTDAAGLTKNILAFSLSPINLDDSQNQYVTKQEFNELKGMIEQYGKQLISNAGRQEQPAGTD